jgi:hypothetical protein
MKLRARKPSPALAVSVMALVVALGGTSYAAAMIGSADIKDDSVRSKDVRDGTLKKRDLRFDPTGEQGPAGPAGPAGPEGPAGPAGADGSGRWVLVNAEGEIEAQSGGFTVTAGYPTLENTAVAPAPDNSQRANGNVYIDAGEDLTDNGIVATIALQNTVDQNADGVTNGRATGPDANPEFSGEIATSLCGLPGTACAPPGTGNTEHFVVSPRLSDGSVTTDGNRKAFYVIITGDSSDQAG